MADLLGASLPQPEKITPENLMNYDVTEELNRFDLNLLNFFCRLTTSPHTRPVDQETYTKRRRNYLSLLLNILVSCRSMNSLSTFSLSLSFLVYWLTGSRYVIDLLSRFGLGASYSTIVTKSHEFADRLPPILSRISNRDCVIWFDNIQKKWKTSRTSIGNKTSFVSVITNIVSFLYDTQIQV